jgi:hypothetical protein
MTNNLVVGTIGVAGIEAAQQMPTDGTTIIEVGKIVMQLIIAGVTLWKMLFAKKD